MNNPYKGSNPCVEIIWEARKIAEAYLHLIPLSKPLGLVTLLSDHTFGEGDKNPNSKKILILNLN